MFIVKWPSKDIPIWSFYGFLKEKNRMLHKEILYNVELECT